MVAEWELMLMDQTEVLGMIVLDLAEVLWMIITLRSLNIDPETCFSNFKHSTSEGVQGLSYHGKQ